MHPIRDVAQAVTGAAESAAGVVKKVLGVKDGAASSDAGSASNAG